MGLMREHELHTRRRGRNIGLGLTLVAFIAIIFGLTVAKVSQGDFQMPAQPGAAQSGSN